LPEMIEKRGNVFAPVPECRNRHVMRPKAIEEILPHQPLNLPFFQILVCGATMRARNRLD
jgi:hypothetical protein